MGTLNSDTQGQLMILKGLTRTTGVLHEAQIIQLKYWAVFLFPKVKFEIRIDQDTRSVEYDFLFSGKSPSKLNEKLVSLEECLQWLLGTEWLLTVLAKGKRVYRGTRKIAAAKKAETKAYKSFIEAIDNYVERDFIKKPVKK